MRRIDADELIAKIDETVKISMFHIKGETLKGAALLVFENFQALVNAAPTIEAEPVRHGKWKHVAGMNSKCSECGRYFPVKEFDSRPFDINYCPNCGAKMDGKE